MKIVEIGGSLTTMLSNEEYILYHKVKKYCSKYNKLPQSKIPLEKRDVIESLVDKHLLNIDGDSYILREIF